MTHTSTEQPERLRANLIDALYSSTEDVTLSAEECQHLGKIISNQHARILELEASQAQRVPLISDSSKVISDEELERAFAGTNFGTKDYRSVLHTAVLKKASGYYCGHTITQIMKELRLIGAKGSPIKRGIEFLRASYHQQMVNGA